MIYLDVFISFSHLHAYVVAVRLIFTPDKFTPDNFTPDNITPENYSPDNFTPDKFTPTNSLPTTTIINKFNPALIFHNFTPVN